MNRERSGGFTLIELLITITIMVALLTLSVVAMRSTQATARDEERKTDVEIIARHLEVFYDSGTDTASAPSSRYLPTLAGTSTSLRLASYTPSDTTARYPSTEAMDTEDEIKFTLRDIDPKALRAPGIAETSPVSLIVASNTSTQNPTINQYIYQPIDRNGALCTSESTDCHKYTLYYRFETSAAVQKIESKHQ